MFRILNKKRFKKIKNLPLNSVERPNNKQTRSWSGAERLALHLHQSEAPSRCCAKDSVFVHSIVLPHILSLND